MIGAAIGLALLVLLVVWAVRDGLRQEERESEILAMLLVYRDLTPAEMVMGCRPLLTRKDVDSTLDLLEEQGLVKAKDSGREAVPRLYSITELGRTEALVRAKEKAA